ncbi:MAG: hypothetical protein CM1200mP29_13160 [Verrucomicrobiota bacterium]|nr:MAG: hypothetical protein CM1200mP29_13160 [Verrucomicrobiota bacterium]
MSHWSFAASFIVILAGIGVLVLAAWLGWGNGQRNGRRGKVALLEVVRFVAVAMLAFTLLQRSIPVSSSVPTRRRSSSSTTPRAACRRAMSSARMTSSPGPPGSTRKTRAPTGHHSGPGSKVMTGPFGTPPGVPTTNALGQTGEIGTDLSGALARCSGSSATSRRAAVDRWRLESWPSPIGVATRYRIRVSPFTVLSPGRDEPIADLAMEEVAAPAYGLFWGADRHTLHGTEPPAARCSTEVRLMQGTEQLAAKKNTLPGE